MGQTAQASREPIAAPAARLYCEDCRFCQPGSASGITYSRCVNPLSPPKNTGDEYLTADYERNYAASNRRQEAHCGPDAKWFEPIPAAQAEAAE
jgi:hypothetical protein